MLTVPAWVWRGGPVVRGLILGVCGGLFFGAVAWLDSGMWLAGAVVFVVLSIASGIRMSLGMRRYWPGRTELTGPQREAVVGAARRGDRIGDVTLAPAVIDFRDALYAAADKRRPLRWLIVVVLVVAVASAVWDGVYGSVGNLIVSAVYVALIGVELFWWPKRQADLLANADRAAEVAREARIAD
jgi:hypothetical protein